jgi:hypothetical protein
MIVVLQLNKHFRPILPHMIVALIDLHRGDSGEMLLIDVSKTLIKKRHFVQWLWVEHHLFFESCNVRMRSSSINEVESFEKESGK